MSITQMKFQDLRRMTEDSPLLSHQLTEEEIHYYIRAWGGHWVHSGDPKEPHPILTSGMHGGEFFDLSYVAQFARAARVLALQMAMRLPEVGSRDWIVGPSYGAGPFVFHLGALLDCKHAVTEKQPDDSQKWLRYLVREGERVQIVEDVTTTGTSALRTRSGLVEGNAEEVEFFPRIAVFVNRSGKDEVDGFQILSLLKVKAPKQWRPEECPLCQLGPSAKPKFKSYLANLPLPTN